MQCHPEDAKRHCDVLPGDCICIAQRLLMVNCAVTSWNGGLLADSRTMEAKYLCRSCLFSALAAASCWRRWAIWAALGSRLITGLLRMLRARLA